MRAYTKRIISIVLTMCLCLAMLPTMAMKAEAATPGYTVSTEYKGSSYYSALCNVTLTGNQRTDIVNVALSQVGYREGSYSGDYGGADDGSYNNYTEYNYWYHNYVSSGMPVGGDSAPWCATFVSWCAEQANIPSSILKRSTAAGHGASYFKVKFYSGSSTLASSGDNDSYFMGYNYTPKAGDLFFTRSWSHVGLVVAVNGSYVITVEGNTNTNGSSQGNGVYKLTSRKITDLYFGVPDYTNTSVKHTVDSRYSAYLPIAAYPISTGHISVYDSAGTIYSNRYIDGATDICIIWEIYTDGWCKVRYPSSAESSGYFDAYVPLSVFTSASAPASWVAENDYTTYKRSDMESSMHSVSRGTTGLLLKTDGYVKQIIHPVSGQSYCMMGWIAEPKQIHSSATSLTLTLGGTSSQTIYAWSTGYYNGNTALYYSRSNSNISCSWGEWTDGKAPLTITANSTGTTTLTLGVKDSDTDTVLDSMTVTVTVGAKSYTVTYNANGGSGAPGSQTKYHNTALTLSSTKPTRPGYTFLGWSTSSTATTATYQPGDSFSSNANTTLYAVWKANTTVLSVNSTNNAVITIGGEMKNFTYTPTTSGKYVIYSTGSDDTKVYLYNASGTELDSDDDDGDGNNFRLEYSLTAGTTYTFGVRYYDSTKTGTISFKFGKVYTVTYNANGGAGAPSAQSKDYGTNITLSSTAPTRTGYTFLGWATSSTATAATYQPGDSFSSNANTTLYAVWKAITYTVNYNANGGSGAPGSQTKYHNTALTLSSTKPTRPGYTFLGWSTSSTATTATYQPGDSFSSNANTTLYAVWQKGCENNAHSYSYKVSKTPTTSATGTLTGTCSKCSGTTTVTLPKLNTTDYTYEVIKEPSYTATGTGRYTWKTTTYGSFYFDVAIPYEAKLEAPVVKASNISSSGKIKLTWEKVEGAVKYEVYRATTETGTYSKLTTVTGTSLTNSSAEAGKTYYYQVRAVDAKGNTSDFSAVVSRTCDLPRPTISSLTVTASTGKIKIKWGAVEGAIKYELYCSTDNENWTRLITTTGTSITHSSGVAGTRYYYKVCAISSNSAANSAYSAVKSGTCDLARPTISSLTVTASTGKIKIKWGAVEGAIKYELYCSTDNENWTRLITTTGTSITHSSGVAGTRYYYKVRAISSNSAAHSAYSTVKNGYCDLAQPTLTVKLNSSGKPVLTWTKISGAVKYEIYCSTDNKTWTKLSITTGTKLTNTSAKAGTTYYYKVQAIASISDSNSAYSTVKAITTK